MEGLLLSVGPCMDRRSKRSVPSQWHSWSGTLGKMPAPAMRILLLLFVLLPTYLRAQDLPDRNWHFRVPLSATVGVNFAHLYNLSGLEFRQTIGPVISLNTGLTVTRRENWGIGLEGGYQADNYSFTNPDASYSITLLSWRAEGRLFKLVPLSESHHMCWSFGLGIGNMFYQGDSIQTLEGSLHAVSRSSEHYLPFLAPEVGLSRRIGRHRAEVLLKYQLNLGDPHAITTNLRTSGSRALAQGTGNYVGVAVRFEYGFKKKRSKPLHMPTPALEYAERETDSVATFHTKRTRISLLLWDNAEVDGDTISVLLNNRPVNVGMALTKRKKKVRMDLLPGENAITIVAHNEGRVPPNTASCIVRNGLERTPLLLKTSLKENDLLRIVRE